MNYIECFLLKIVDWNCGFPLDCAKMEDVFKSYYDAYQYIEKMFPDCKYISKVETSYNCFGEEVTMIYDYFEYCYRNERITIEIKPVKLHEII